MKKVILDLKGMSCASCALTIEKALNNKSNGKAVVNFAIERAIVEGENIDEEKLIEHSKKHRIRCLFDKSRRGQYIRQEIDL